MTQSANVACGVLLPAKLVLTKPEKVFLSIPISLSSFAGHCQRGPEASTLFLEGGQSSYLNPERLMSVYGRGISWIGGS